MAPLSSVLDGFQQTLLDAKDWAPGSHDKSNWLIPGWLLVGGWPFRLPKGRGSPGESEEEGAAKLSSILAAGIRTFVSLTEADEIRGKAYCYSSFRSCAERQHQALSGLPRRQAKRQGSELRFLECPMPDGGTCCDEKVLQLLERIIAELHEGRAVYLHCYGGHGRSGLVGCGLLCWLLEVEPAEAVKIFNELHAFRVECGVGGPGQFPHSDQQLEQVYRLAEQGKLPMVSYNPATGTSSLEFSCGGISHTFHIGEVWKLGSASGLRVTHPLEVSEQIHLASQKHLDASNNKVETTLNLQMTLTNSSSAPLLRSGDKTLKKANSEATMRLPLEHFKTLSEGRMDFKQEHQLKALTTKVHPTLARPKVSRTMREGYMWPAPHPGKVPVDPLRIAPPLSLEKISSSDVEKRAASLEAGQMLAVLVVASWSKQSNYSSSAHAEIVAQAAWSELKTAGEERLTFCIADLSEAGAIYSSTKFENPLVVKYGVKEAPWLLLFARGELIFSENPSAPRSGGLGFAARLRYKAFALPQVLIVEPAPNVSALQQQAAQVAQESNGRLTGTQNVVNNFQLQLQTQEVLKRAGYDFELAITSSDALRLASCAQPPYGLLLCSSQVPAAAITELTARMRQRNPKVLAFLCHDAKQLGDFDEATQNLIDQQQVAGVIYRPITRSALQRALRGHPEANVQYPTCGMVKEDIMDLLKRKLGSL